MALTDVLTGAVSLGRSLIRPTRAIDVVAVLGPGFSPLFQNMRPLTAEVRETADLMEHPIETGSVIADHIVFDPIEIMLPVVVVGELEYRSTYAILKSTFRAGTILTVMTRTGLYSNMVIMEIPHEETPAAFNAVAIRVLLREAMMVTPKSRALTQSEVKDAKNASTVAKGSQQTTAANTAKSSAAASSYSSSGSGVPASGSQLYRWTYGQ